MFNQTLISQFGQIDIYLFDQFLRGRLAQGTRVFDAGCGDGRNLTYLLANGFEVFACDHDVRSIDLVRSRATSLPPDNFRVEAIESNSFPNALAGFVICSAVLHFAHDEDHFRAMLHGAWRVLAPNGIFFCRLASSIGIEDQIAQLNGRTFLLPDGSERFLVDEPLLLQLTDQLNARLLDPIKTTVVQNQRSMTTWVLRKS